MRSFRIFAAITVFILLGIIVPKIVIPDVQAETDASSKHMPTYALVQMNNTAGLIQHGLWVKVSVVEIHPNPDGCDWGYREPVTGTAIVRAYTLWGILVETWEVTCNAGHRISDSWF